MTQIKLFSSSKLETVEKDVNEFISTVTVVSVQLSSTSDSVDVLVLYRKEAAQ